MGLRNYFFTKIFKLKCSMGSIDIKNNFSSSEERLPRLTLAPQNKQISLPQIIFTQSQHQNTSITTMPPL